MFFVKICFPLPLQEATCTLKRLHLEDLEKMQNLCSMFQKVDKNPVFHFTITCMVHQLGRSVFTVVIRKYLTCLEIRETTGSQRKETYISRARWFFFIFLIYIFIFIFSIYSSMQPIHLFIRSLVPSFVRSFVYSFTGSFVCSFIRSFFRLFVCSFFRSFVCFFMCMVFQFLSFSSNEFSELYK